MNVIYYVQLSDTASAWWEEGGLALEIVEMLYYLLIDAYESVAVAYYESFYLGYDFRDCIQESVNIFYTEGSWDLPFGGERGSGWGASFSYCCKKVELTKPGWGPGDGPEPFDPFDDPEKEQAQPS